MKEEKSSENKLMYSGENEKQATSSIAQKSIEKMQHKPVMKVRPDQIPLYARRFYMKALLDVVNYMESIDKYE